MPAAFELAPKPNLTPQCSSRDLDLRRVLSRDQKRSRLAENYVPEQENGACSPQAWLFYATSQAHEPSLNHGPQEARFRYSG